MKKLFNSFLVLLCISSQIFAQELIVTHTSVLAENEINEYFNPQFSPDGSRIFFTTSSNKGIYYYDLSEKSVVKLNDELGAGYKFMVSKNGRYVYFRSDKYINGRKYSSLKSQNVEDNSISTLISGKRNLSTPRLLKSGIVAYTLNRRLNYLNFEKKSLNKTTSSNDVFVTIENCNLVLYSYEEKQILNPLGNGNYIWPSLSPDNSKILFTLAGKGTFVCDLFGNIISSLGYANSPKWSPDGKWILYMVDKDDGYTVISSDLYIVSFDGSRKFELTNTDDVNEMYPEWSPDGNKIVCNTSDGKIILMNLSSK